MKFRITTISKGFYSLSIWDKENVLLFVYTGNEKKIKSRAKEFNYDVSLKMKILKEDGYKLGYI